MASWCCRCEAAISYKKCETNSNFLVKELTTGKF